MRAFPPFSHRPEAAQKGKISSPRIICNARRFFTSLLDRNLHLQRLGCRGEIRQVAAVTAWTDPQPQGECELIPPPVRGQRSDIVVLLGFLSVELSPPTPIEVAQRQAAVKRMTSRLRVRQLQAEDEQNYASPFRFHRPAVCDRSIRAPMHSIA